jgi:hypothetical protein
MSRPLRIQYPGAWYHVMNRGRRGEAIFSEARDYTAFIDLINETKSGDTIVISCRINSMKKSRL